MSPIEVLRRARLPQSLFGQDQITVATEQFFALWSAIAEVSGDPAIGLKIATDRRIEIYDPASIAALSAQTFHDALRRLARYKHLVCSEEVRLTESDNHCIVEFAWPNATASPPSVLLDAAFAAVILLGKRGAGRALPPEYVEFTRAPKHREMYETQYGCPVRFRAERDALVYSAASIAQPFITSNPDMLSMLAPQLEQAMADHASRQTLPGQVKAIQKRLLAGQRASIDHVAAELNMSPRTLQRRLTESGVKYQNLLENVRRELAQQYLREPSLNLTEISYLLGYEETNSFHRAFQGWAGISPGQWRNKNAPRSTQEIGGRS